jgi:hypothetical protein
VDLSIPSPVVGLSTCIVPDALWKRSRVSCPCGPYISIYANKGKQKTNERVSRERVEENHYSTRYQPAFTDLPQYYIYCALHGYVLTMYALHPKITRLFYGHSYQDSHDKLSIGWNRHSLCIISYAWCSI